MICAVRERVELLGSAEKNAKISYNYQTEQFCQADVLGVKDEHEVGMIRDASNEYNVDNVVQDEDQAEQQAEKGTMGKRDQVSTNSKLRKMIKQLEEQKKELNNWGEMMERAEPNTTAGEELFQIPTPLHCALQ